MEQPTAPPPTIKTSKYSGSSVFVVVVFVALDDRARRRLVPVGTCSVRNHFDDADADADAVSFNLGDKHL